MSEYPLPPSHLLANKYIRTSEHNNLLRTYHKQTKTEHRDLGTYNKQTKQNVGTSY